MTSNDQPTPDQRMRGVSPQWIACWITIGYAVCASLYAVISDRLLTYLITDPAKLSELQTYKTLLLVAVSSVIVYELARRALRYSGRLQYREPRRESKAVSLRTQVNALILAAAVPLTVLLGYLIYFQAAERAGAAHESVEAAARAVARDTERFISIAQHKLAGIALRIGDGEALEPCDPAFEYFAVLNPEFTALLLWLPSGDVICPSAHRDVRYSGAARPPWLARTLAEGTPLVSEPYPGPLSGKWITVLSYPLKDRQGAIRGVLDLSVDLDTFAPMSMPVIRAADMLAILDSSGRIAAGKGAAAIPGSTNGTLATRIRLGQRGSALSTDSDGIERIHGYAPVAGTDWMAVTGVPVDRVFASVYETMVRIVLVALAIVFAASYASYRVSLRIERPIMITARTAQAVAAGRTDARAPVIGPAETQVVARQFNLMLDERVATERRLAQLLDQEHQARIDAERMHAELAALRDNLERTVAERTDELVQRNRDLETFAYAVAHDLRAPLRSMSGFASVLEQENGKRLDQTGRDSIGRIVAAVARMNGLIDGLLALARASRSEIVREALDLSAMATEAIADLQRHDPGRSVVVEVEPGLRVHADRELTRDLLINLLDNAWKYTVLEKDARVKFYRYRTDDASTVFCVSDNGVGFDPAEAGRLFQPFFRLHGGRTFPGTGIGLATVKRIVDRHGGRIWVESKPAAGTSVFFTL